MTETTTRRDSNSYTIQRYPLIRLYLILLSLLLTTNVCTGEEVVSRRSLLAYATIPKFPDTDIIELYHLRSFSLPLIESNNKKFTIETSGIAFRSLASTQTVVLEFRPLNFSSCFLPILAVVNNKKRIQWNNEADVMFSTTIDTSYWQQSTYLAHMNGIAFKKYLVWVQEFIMESKYFVPQSLCTSAYKPSCYFFTRTWDTFLSRR